MVDLLEKAAHSTFDATVFNFKGLGDSS